MSLTMLRRLSTSLRPPRRRSHHLLASFEINQFNSGPSRSHSNPPAPSSITLLGLSYLCQPVLEQAPQEATSDSKAFFLRYGLDDLRQEEASYLLIYTLVLVDSHAYPARFVFIPQTLFDATQCIIFWIYFLLIPFSMHFSPHPHQAHFVSCLAKERRNMLSNCFIVVQLPRFVGFTRE